MISIIIPVYNEQQIIGETITELIKIMDGYTYQYEIVVVNDGSKDKTGEIIKKVKHGKMHYIEHAQNQGYGASLKTGIHQALYEYVLIIDADGSYPPEHIPVLMDSIANNDMVVGARTGKDVKMPLIRKPAKWFINKLANFLVAKTIPDLNSGMRLMKKEIVQKFLKILPNGFSFTTTITLAMLTNDCKAKFVPINYYKRKGKSKI